MKLEKFQVQNYRSIIDSGEIEAEDIMVLVGPNQAGKSSILKGLNSISFNHVFDVDNDLTQLNDINKKYIDEDLQPTDLPIVTATFSLDGKDREMLKEKLLEKEESEGVQTKVSDKSDNTSEQEIVQSATDEILESNIPKAEQIDSLQEIKVTKFIDESYSVDLGGYTYKFENPYLIVKNCGEILNELKTKAKEEFEGKPNVDFKTQFDNALKTVKKSLPEDGFRIYDKSDLYTPLKQFTTNPLTDSVKEKIQGTVSELESSLENYPIFDVLKIVSFLIERIPRTVYFKDYNRLEDSITIQELKTNPRRHSAFINMLKIAEVRIDSIEQQEGNQSAIQQYLNSASAIATKKLRKVWEQESFDLQLRYDNGTILVFTTDPKNPGTLLPPSYGSEGFQWFLGFYINFAVATRTEYKNAILLLDDPGVLLHPSGHKDLIRRFISYLDDEVRTIYSTHLPSLINKASIDSIRVVYKEDGQTHVVKNFWKLSNLDAWAPIRSSLGIDFTDSLFFGNQTAVVEGPSDAVYMQGFLSIFRNQGKNFGLGFLLPMNGLDNLDYFMKFFSSQGLPFVAVVDAVPKTEDTSKIVKISPKNKEREGQTEFDIEDMIENELLSKALSRSYVEVDEKEVLQRLSSSNSKAIKILKGYLVEKGLNHNKLDKVKISNQIVKLVKENPDKYQKTIQNFEELFSNIQQKFSTT